MKFRQFLHTLWGKLTIALVALLIVAGAALGVYAHWYNAQPKFQGVTMELGEEMPDLAHFCTDFANPDKAVFVTEVGQIDLSLVGGQSVTLRQGKHEETVTLTIQDTTAPTLELRDLSVAIDYVPTVEELVVSCDDLSEVEITFAEPLTPPEEYGDIQVKILAVDAYGNTTSGTCSISYLWMRESYVMELGEILSKEDLLLNPNDVELLDQADIDAINAASVGEYTVASTVAGQTRICTVTVQDTTPPEISLKSVTIYKGDKVTLDSFLVSAEDLSGEPALKFASEPDINKEGEQTVTITATDKYGNETVAETKLKVIRDTEAPVFSGLSVMNIKKKSVPDYTAGVTARDNRDGNVKFTYDASGVNTSVSGTYYVKYTATDRAGNTTTYRRKVVVGHDSADTNALVASMAAKCGNDPMSIKIFVRDLIMYTSYDGGTDPIWQGFKNKSGNCLVHAKCLQAILEYKGYRTKLIWVTDKSHYWLLIDMGGYWRHIDATPGPSHGATGLMTDEERLATLRGRVWDTSAWPACT